jgi:phage terminase Nu1 subunit (DNA packaging protein)
MIEWYKYWEDQNRIIFVYSKAEMAECMEVTLKTVDDWIRKGAPVFERGGNGKPYRLDAIAFVEWVRSYRAGISIEELRRRDERDPAQHMLRALFELEVENARLKKASNGRGRPAT